MNPTRTAPLRPVLLAALLAGCAASPAHDASRPSADPRAAASSTGAASPDAPSIAVAGPPPASMAAASPAAGVDPDIAALWHDPSFLKQFIGGYGVNSDVEPRVGPEEVAVLEQVRPLMADRLPEAEALLAPLIKPESSAILDCTLGAIQYQQDELPAARRSFEAAVAKFPSFRRAWRNLGLIDVHDERYDDAIAAFTKMIELGGGDGYSYGLLGFAYDSRADYQAAEAAYRNALLLQPDSTEWRLHLTQCVFKQQKYEDAATLLNALLARFPDKAEFWLLQAQTYLALKQPVDAAEDLEIVDQLGKSTVDSLHTLGDIYIGEELMDLACSAYRRAIDVDPAQPLARPLHAADVLAAHGAVAQARQLSTHIHEVCDARLDDAGRRDLLKLDARLSMAEGADSAETAAVLEELVRLDPLDGDALLLLGQHYSRQNEPDRAILAYERAESLDKFEATARLGHAQVLVHMGRFADALPLLRRVQELRPRDDVARYLDQVERASKAH